MKLPLVTAILATCLAACSGGDDAAERATADTTPATAAVADTATGDEAAAPVRGPKGRPLASPLPRGVELTFPLHFRSDRLVDKNGTELRRIKLEYLGGDVQSVADSITDSMRAAGLNAGATKTLPGGGQRLLFSKRDLGRVIVDVYPPEGQKLRHPKSSGMVVMTWPKDA